MPIVIEPGLDAGGFCLQLKQAIKDMGVAKAFGIGKIVVAYSGPSSTVRGAITTSFTGNWDRSQQQASRLGGRRIDDTTVGKFLTSFDFGIYFTDFYGHDRAARERAEFEVWGCASTEFMKAKFQELATAVCAADPERVFRKYEIGAVLKNRRVHVINGRPAQLFRDFHEIHPDEAYRLFCLTEILEARKHAQSVGTKGAWEDYRERRCFFMLEQKEARAISVTSATRATYKLQKYRILLTHRLTASIGTPAMPARKARSLKVSRAPT